MADRNGPPSTGADRKTSSPAGHRSPATHELKTHPGPFQATKEGRKPYEVRTTDRDFQVGDLLRLREWDPESQRYTGEELLRRVGYITPGNHWGLPEDICVLALAPAEPEDYFVRIQALPPVISGLKRHALDEIAELLTLSGSPEDRIVAEVQKLRDTLHQADATDAVHAAQEVVAAREKVAGTAALLEDANTELASLRAQVGRARDTLHMALSVMQAILTAHQDKVPHQPDGVLHRGNDWLRETVAMVRETLMAVPPAAPKPTVITTPLSRTIAEPVVIEDDAPKPEPSGPCQHLLSEEREKCRHGLFFGTTCGACIEACGECASNCGVEPKPEAEAKPMRWRCDSCGAEKVGPPLGLPHAGGNGEACMGPVSLVASPTPAEKSRGFTASEAAEYEAALKPLFAPAEKPKTYVKVGEHQGGQAIWAEKPAPEGAAWKHCRDCGRGHPEGDHSAGVPVEGGPMAALTAERDHLRAEVERLKALDDATGWDASCPFCDWRHGSTTTRFIADANQAAHLATCPKNPLRAELDKAKAELASERRVFQTDMHAAFKQKEALKADLARVTQERDEATAHGNLACAELAQTKAGADAVNRTSVILAEEHAAMKAERDAIAERTAEGIARWFELANDKASANAIRALDLKAVAPSGPKPAPTAHTDLDLVRAELGIAKAAHRTACELLGEKHVELEAEQRALRHFKAVAKPVCDLALAWYRNAVTKPGGEEAATLALNQAIDKLRGLVPEAKR